VKNVNLSNANKFKPLKHEVEKMKNYAEELNNTLETCIVELSNKKSINSVSMNLATAALDRNKNLELKIQDRLYYKEKLEAAAEELENVRVKKNDLLKRYLYLSRVNYIPNVIFYYVTIKSIIISLEESEVALANANEKIHVLSEKSNNKYYEKLKEVEEQ